MSGDNLNIARRKLNMVLADKAPIYFTHMKHWFQMKQSKEKFDSAARRLLNPEQVHFHNEFLLALLNKVGGLTDTSISVAHERAFSYGQSKKQRVATASSSSADLRMVPRFDPVDLSDYLPPKSPQGAGIDGVKYVAQETFLPDQSLVVGRFMLAAWDHDLEGVEDDAAKIVVIATQQFLKNLLQAIISQRKSYKTHNGLMYDLGADAPNMWLRNSSRVVEPLMREPIEVSVFDRDPSVDFRRPPTVDEREHNAALEMACSAQKEENEEPLVLTIEDVYSTLLANRNIIASQSVYAVNMERIANMLGHPST